MATPDPAVIDDGLRTRLREARRACGLLQKDVSEKLGVSRRAVVEWEGGQRRPHQKLPELAALYGVSTSYLLTGVEPATVELAALRERLTQQDDAIDRNYELLSEVATRLDRLAESVAALAEAMERHVRADEAAGRGSPRTTRRPTPSLR